MSILIGNARGGDPTYAPGDQTGAEVRTQAWYLHSSGWHFVARFKDRKKAARAAKFCRDACANPHIGYGMGDRNTLRPLAKEANWDASKITQDCNCDCTSFASVCAEAGGVSMDGAYSWGNAPYSENIRQKLEATGEFVILTDAKYLTSDQYLMCGDIVVNEPAYTGHAIMVLEDGPLAGAAVATQPASPSVVVGATASTTVAVKPTTGTEKPAAGNTVNTERTYTVQSGDTLWGIATKYLGRGIRYTEIVSLNSLKGDIIYPGQVLKLPE